jgi:hypothetical protein
VADQENRMGSGNSGNCSARGVCSDVVPQAGSRTQYIMRLHGDLSHLKLLSEYGIRTLCECDKVVGVRMIGASGETFIADTPTQICDA